MNSVSFKTNTKIQYSYPVDKKPNTFLNYSDSVIINEYLWQSIRIRIQFLITPIRFTPSLWGVILFRSQFAGVSRLFLMYFKKLSWKCLECFKKGSKRFQGVLRKFQCCFWEISSVFQKCFKGKSRKFQGNLKIVSRKFQGRL